MTIPPVHHLANILVLYSINKSDNTIARLYNNGRSNNQLIHKDLFGPTSKVCI